MSDSNSIDREQQKRERKRESGRRWRARNPEKVQAKNRRRDEKHRLLMQTDPAYVEAQRVHRQELYKANREKILASQRRKRQENLEEYQKRDRERERKRPDRKERFQRWYAKNGERWKAKVNVYREANKEKIRARCQLHLDFLDSIKRQLGCKRCGMRDTDCLEFHHIDPATKTKEVTVFIKHSRRRLLEEVSKCEVVCASCHCKMHPRTESPNMRPGHRRKKAIADEVRRKSGCIRCGERDLACLEFHHKKPRQKKRGVVTYYCHGPMKAFLAELRRCIVLCANCHAKEHAAARRLPTSLRKVMIQGELFN